MSLNMKTKKLKDMSIDEFFSADLDSDSGSSSTKSTDNNDFNIMPRPRSNKTKLSMNGTASKAKGDNIKVNKCTKNKKSTMEIKIEEEKATKEVKKKKKDKIPKSKKLSDKSTVPQSLAQSLQDNDPEFYNFLKDEDKGLLSNLEGLSDDDEDSEDDHLEADGVSSGTKKSRRGDFEKELVDMSSGEESDSDVDMEQAKGEDESPDDDDNDDDGDDDGDQKEAGDGDEEMPVVKKGGILVTLKMVDGWDKELSSKSSIPVFRQVVSVFHAAVQEAGGAVDQGTRYRVEGSSIYNAVVRLCLKRVVPALQSLLKLSTLSSGVRPNSLDSQGGLFKRIRDSVKKYIGDALFLLSQLSEAVMVNVILKHVHKLIVFYAYFPKICKMLLKRTIKIWTSGEETTRVLAFLCINKLVRLSQDSLLEPCLKQMYMAYVSNCKFTSPNTLPLINFLQRSLVEMLNMDQAVAYQYAFIYIRQLAIHLRNAISVKKDSTCQAVYNWQFMHCLGLWVQLLASTFPSEVLQPLVYPLTQTIIGTINLLPNTRFYPLRFHCVRLLIQLSERTETFIPTLPLVLHVLDQVDFNKFHKTVSMKPFNFAVILKLSKSQLQEKAFKDGVVDQLYELLLESYHSQSCSIGFPEMIIPSVIQLKEFLKKCKIANYCKPLKSLVDKVMEQGAFISEKRKYCGIGLNNPSAIAQWEKKIKSEGTPLDKFYTSWKKLREREILMEISQKDEISGASVEIPELEKKLEKGHFSKKATAEERQDLSKLFEYESDEDDETRFLLKEERPTKTLGKRKRQDSESEDNSDDYSDFDDDELEQLAQSASSGEESDMGDDDNDDDDDDEDDDDDDDDGAEQSDDTSEEETGVQVTYRKKNNNKEINRKVDNAPAKGVSKNTNKKKRRFDINESIVEADDVVEDFNFAEFDSD